MENVSLRNSLVVFSLHVSQMNAEDLVSYHNTVLDRIFICFVGSDFEILCVVYSTC